MKSSIKLFAATAIVSYTGLVAAAPTNNSSLAIRDYPPQFMVWKLQHSIDSNDRRYVFWDTWNPMPSCDQLLTHQSFQVSESNDVSKTRGVRVKGSDSTPKEIEYNIGSPYGHNSKFISMSIEHNSADIIT
ncbi:hypothetical protein BKA67DRAFT_364711 [Truncatella angustata]|uniref:Uncharacterized protein n=1 Tax=Truncatella angustata TaxID=152316 RepID=A0A9P8UEI1_9PEZI|nr:uncharacterized protein BKA67DRAFT_364711 [Truncatella angustata]KAH6648466.1 hypothetical protein BKA67DRAFT_364711 [Truncatella angustata]